MAKTSKNSRAGRDKRKKAALAAIAIVLAVLMAMGMIAPFLGGVAQSVNPQPVTVTAAVGGS